MKTKPLCLTLLLMLTALCALTPRVLANDGDWLETNYSIWWWKHVRPATLSKIAVSQVRVIPVRSPQPGYLANQITITLTNKSNQDYKGGDPYLLEYGFCEPVPEPWKGPSPWKPVTITKGVLSSLAVGMELDAGSCPTRALDGTPASLPTGVPENMWSGSPFLFSQALSRLRSARSIIATSVSITTIGFGISRRQ